MHYKYLPMSHTKPQKTFLRLCMGQREVLTVHEFSVLSWGQIPPLSRHVKATVETSSAKCSATTNFLSSLHTLNKGIFHDILQNDNNRKTHVKSTRAMTRERGSPAESKNCEILLFPTADRRFDAFPTVRSLTRVKCPGIARGDGRFWN